MQIGSRHGSSQAAMRSRPFFTLSAGPYSDRGCLSAIRREFRMRRRPLTGVNSSCYSKILGITPCLLDRFGEPGIFSTKPSLELPRCAGSVQTVQWIKHPSPSCCALSRLKADPPSTNLLIGCYPEFVANAWAENEFPFGQPWANYKISHGNRNF